MEESAKRTSRFYCIYPNCSNSNRSKRATSFAFPTDPSTRKQWREILNVSEEFLNSRSKRRCTVCEAHFAASDILRFQKVGDTILYDQPKLRPTLLKGAVPFPPPTSKQKKVGRKGGGGDFETILLPTYRRPRRCQKRIVDAAEVETEEELIEEPDSRRFLEELRPDWFYRPKNGPWKEIFKVAEEKERTVVKYSLKVAGSGLSLFVEGREVEVEQLKRLLNIEGNVLAPENLKAVIDCLDFNPKVLDSIGSQDEAAGQEEEDQMRKILRFVKGEHQICRFCFSDVDQTLKFITHETRSAYERLIRENLDFSSRLPEKVCLTCIGRLQTAAEFQGRVLDAEKLLKDFLTFSAEGSLPAQMPSKRVNAPAEVTISHFSDAELEAKGPIEAEIWRRMIDEGLIRLLDSQSGAVSYKCVKCQQDLKATGLKSHFTRGPRHVEGVVEEEERISERLKATGYREVVTEEGVVNYQCRPCNRSWPNRRRALWHFRSVHFRERSECPKCDRTFYCPNTLRRHIRQVHERCPLTCQTCGKRVLNAFRLKLHRENSHGTFTQFCHRCGAWFKYPFLLQKHIAERHNEEGAYSCNECSARFSSRGKLRNHTLDAHPDVQLPCHLCSRCGRSFFSNAVLASHQQSCLTKSTPPPAVVVAEYYEVVAEDEEEFIEEDVLFDDE